MQKIGTLRNKGVKLSAKGIEGTHSLGAFCHFYYQLQEKGFTYAPSACITGGVRRSACKENPPGH